MMRSLLLRGMLAGAIAGVLACVFAKVFGEPQIDKAIGFEDHLALLSGRTPEAPVVSRGVQSTVGLLLAAVVYGTALGGIFALTFAYAYGRIGAVRARAVAAVLAAGGFVTIALVPFLKYPASPPAVGSPDTIGRRTALYFVLIAISVCSAVAAARVRRAVRVRHDGWTSGLAAAATFVVLVAAAGLALPGVHEVPRGFPADVLWRFRLSAIGMQVVLWGALGLVFGPLAERLIARLAAEGVRAPDVSA